MDFILSEVTSTSFWVNVLAGQVLFIGGIFYLIYSTRKDFEKQSTQNNQSKTISNQ